MTYFQNPIFVFLLIFSALGWTKTALDWNPVGSPGWHEYNKHTSVSLEFKSSNKTVRFWLVGRNTEVFVPRGRWCVRLTVEQGGPLQYRSYLQNHGALYRITATGGTTRTLVLARSVPQMSPSCGDLF